MTQRAFTNPFSNAVVLSRFNLGEGVDTFARMQLPLRCLPQFMHEAMHHWCFDSPVGLATALLQMRARRKAVAALLSEGDDEKRYSVAQDIARVSFSLEFMRPVAEGLALFSEHDVTIGSSEIIGRPAFLAATMFAGRQSDPKEYLRLAPILIETARLSFAHIRRKADLLLAPFSASVDRYLAGYLYVRLLYRIVVERRSAYADSEFFAHVLRCWLCDDWDYVNLLLDDSEDYEQWLQRLVVYCQERMARFLEISDEQLSDFEQRSLRADANLFEYSGQFLHLQSHSHPVTPPRDERAAKARMERILQELLQEQPEHPALIGMFRTDLDMLGLRTTLTLGHASFDAKVTKERMIQLATDGFPLPVFSTRAPDNLPAGWAAKVNVDLLLATTPPGLYQFIHDDSGILAAHSFGADREIPEHLRTPLVNWEKRHGVMEFADRVVAQVLADSVEEMMLQLSMDRVRNTRNDIFDVKGLSIVPDEYIKPAQTLMAQDGFLAVLDGSLQLLLDTAAISLCTSLRARPSDVLPDWPWSRGGALETAEYINKAFLRSVGYRPFLIADQELLFSMI